MSLVLPRAGCELCDTPSAATLQVLEQAAFRVVRVLDAPAFPAFYRVIWRAHVAEWTDLTADERAVCMEAVAGVEQALRAALRPSKINIASLGNVVPHLHWHVIARFEGDTHFPHPIWAAAQRPADEAMLEALGAGMPAVDAGIVRALSYPGFGSIDKR